MTDFILLEEGVNADLLAEFLGEFFKILFIIGILNMQYVSM